MNIQIELPLNADVVCLDGVCGQSLELVINPEDNQVTHLVVKENSTEKAERLVPIGLIEGTSNDHIHLCCNKSDLQGFDVFCERDVVMREISKASVYHDSFGTYYSFPVTRPIVIENKSIPKGELAFNQGTPVEATDGRIGKLEKLLISPETEKITHFVARTGTLLGPQTLIIPLSAIDHFSGSGIFLSIAKKELRELQHLGISS